MPVTPPALSDEDQDAKALNRVLNSKERDFGNLAGGGYEQLYKDVKVDGGVLTVMLPPEDGYSSSVTAYVDDFGVVTEVVLSAYDNDVDVEREVAPDSVIWEAMQALVERN